MKKILFVLFILIVGCFSLSSRNKESEVISQDSIKTYTMEEIAEKTNAGIGKTAHSYAIEPKGGMSVNRIIKSKNVINGGTEFGNSIILECVAGYDYMRNFLKDYAAFSLITNKYETDANLTTYVFNGKDNLGDSWVYVVVESEKDLADVEYIEINGLSKKNESSSILFKASSEEVDTFTIY